MLQTSSAKPYPAGSIIGTASSAGLRSNAGATDCNYSLTPPSQNPFFHYIFDPYLTTVQTRHQRQRLSLLCKLLAINSPAQALGAMPSAPVLLKRA